MKKSLISGALVACASLAVVTMPQASDAAERNFGGKSCAQGSVYTRADATQDVTHAVYQSSGATAKRTFTGGVSYRVTTFYSGVQVSTRALVQTTGAIRTASMNCAD